jgi:hypothetical protein
VLGNSLIVVHGIAPPGYDGSSITVSDTVGSAYSDVIDNSRPVAQTWSSYAFNPADGFNNTVTVSYLNRFTSVTSVSEWVNSDGGNMDDQLDGTTFSAGPSKAILGSVKTHLANDLVLAIYLLNNGHAPTIGAGWNLGWSQAINFYAGYSTAVYWAQVPLGGVTQSFKATQVTPASSAWTVAMFAFQGVVVPATVVLQTAAINITDFTEVYPNRVAEDFYDSLQGDPFFNYVPFGPSYNSP